MGKIANTIQEIIKIRYNHIIFLYSTTMKLIKVAAPTELGRAERLGLIKQVESLKKRFEVAMRDLMKKVPLERVEEKMEKTASADEMLAIEAGLGSLVRSLGRVVPKVGKKIGDLMKKYDISAAEVIAALIWVMERMVDVAEKKNVKELADKDLGSKAIDVEVEKDKPKVRGKQRARIVKVPVA